MGKSPHTVRRFGVVAALIILALQAPSFAQKLPQPILEHAALPLYPPIAIAARLKGTVKLTFILSQNGDVAEVQAISGPKPLSEAAVEEVKTWRFRLPHDLFRTEWRYETEFVYRFSGREVETNAVPKLAVSLSTFDHIEIVSDAVKPIMQY